MSKICEICGKKQLVGNRVSHAHNRTKRIFSPNLQTIRTDKNGEMLRMKICTRCLKTLTKDQGKGQDLQALSAEASA